MTCCQVCYTHPADQLHHKFSQTKWAKRLYGELIHDPRNLMQVCADCHASHASPKLVHWSEQEFCQALGIDSRSKTSQIEKLGSCL